MFAPLLAKFCTPPPPPPPEFIPEAFGILVHWVGWRFSEFQGDKSSGPGSYLLYAQAGGGGGGGGGGYQLLEHNGPGY